MIFNAMESYASEREAKWRELWEAMKESVKDLLIGYPTPTSMGFKTLSKRITELEKELNLQP